MNIFSLVQPSIEHEKQYEDMMDEWEAYEGRLNPGALRRYSFSQKRKVSYKEWLKWIVDDRNAGQELFFLTNDERILGAVSIRPKKSVENIGLDGHIGFGIRPSERNKGYATKILSMALPILKNYGIDQAIITCDKENIGSSKTIQNNGGMLKNEVANEETGNVVQVYNIQL
ncbi:MAG: GNAT family N-acetyltransferase [Ruminiclostridium sp.]|nr:GNAT family N-acetyltransferase [Ruminiclostridium sp.]